MTFEEIEAFLAEQKDSEEAKGFLAKIAPKPVINGETIGEFLATEEGYKLVKTHKAADERVTEAIETFKKKQAPVTEAELKRRIAEEMVKLNPQETPEQKRIRELEQSFEA